MMAERGGAPPFAGSLGWRAWLCLGPIALIIVRAFRHAHYVWEPPIATGNPFSEMSVVVDEIVLESSRRVASLQRPRIPPRTFQKLGAQVVN